MSAVGPLDGTAVITRVVVGADPAAGAEASVIVPGNVLWRLLVVRLRLVASAAVANRRVAIVFSDGAVDHYLLTTGVAQTAGQTFIYSFGADFGAVVQDLAGGLHSGSLPLLELAAGGSVRTETVDLQAGDNFDAPVLLVQERSSQGAQGAQAGLGLVNPGIGEQALGG